ncbi:MAG TPA: tetratricopeptide repeat protein [Polyangiales bacterium]
MKRLPSIPVVVIVASLLSGLCGTAVAAPRRSHKAAPEPQAAAAVPGPTPEAKEAARAAYGRGQAAFSAGNFDEAASAFEAAYKAVPNPIVLLSISESRAKLGQIDLAIAALQKYLEVRADAPDRADVEGKLQALSATPAQLSVTSEPSGAELDMDGVPTQKKTPVQLAIAPGAHELHAMLHGRQSETQSVTVSPGDKQELHFKLAALAPVEAPAVAAATTSETTQAAPLSDIEPAPEPASSARPMTAIWVTGGIGAAALVTGTVLGFLAVKEHSNFETHPTTATADRGERYALFADVGFGVGVMAIATAAVLYLTSSDAPSEAQSHGRQPVQHAHLQLVPALSPSSASATARLQF